MASFSLPLQKGKLNLFGCFWITGNPSVPVTLLLIIIQSDIVDICSMHCSKHLHLQSNLRCVPRVDPEARVGPYGGESASAVELAAVHGHIETFELLTATLEIDSNSDWFQLAQVSDKSEVV